MSDEILNSFNNLITNDKESLVEQVMQICASNNQAMDATTARFYLDMSNWNVTNAVSAFYDNGCQPIIMNYQFRFLRDVTIGEGESVQPNTKFTKTWLVTNSGNQQWPNRNLCLRFCQGEFMSAEANSIKVPSLHPGQEHEISVDMTSPVEPGYYSSQWRMYYDGYTIGDPIWVILEVSQTGILGMMQQMESSISNWTNNNKEHDTTNHVVKNPFQL